MIKIKFKSNLSITANMVNLFIAVLVVCAYLLIKLPANTYFQANVALFLYPLVVALSFFSVPSCVALLLISLKRGCLGILICLAIAVNIGLVWFNLSIFYPWARYTVHFPHPQSIYWREQAISSVGDDLYFFISKRQGLIPSNDNWKEILVESGYDIENWIQTWHSNYNSTIVLNENIKGMELDKLNPKTVLLFEGPKDTAFGNEEDFRQFSKQNKYSYVVLVNNQKGRICLEENKAQYMFYGIESSDLPLIWR